MANSKISALTSATTPLAGTETLPVVQSSTTKQVSVANLTAGRNVSVLQLGAGVASPATVLDTAGGTGSALNFKMAPNGWNIRHRVGVQYTGDGSVWSNNALMSSATAGNLDDTSNSGSALLLNTSGNLSYVTATAGANPRTFTNQWTADGSGNFTLSTGNLVQGTAAKGINFTANTPAAGKTSQLLNWYEEGTFTPTWNGGTVTVNSSYYTRVGRLVNWILDITFGTSATVANSQLTLPFTATGSWGGGSINYTDYGTTATINIDAAANGLFFRSAVNGGNLNCPLVATKRFICVITYFA